jgi:hypothetical protein
MIGTSWRGYPRAASAHARIERENQAQAISAS